MPRSVPAECEYIDRDLFDHLVFCHEPVRDGVAVNGISPVYVCVAHSKKMVRSFNHKSFKVRVMEVA